MPRNEPRAFSVPHGVPSYSEAAETRRSRFENWEEFLSRGDRPLKEAEVEDTA